MKLVGINSEIEARGADRYLVLKVGDTEFHREWVSKHDDPDDEWIEWKTAMIFRDVFAR